jgi:hypothetical protein
LADGCRHRCDGCQQAALIVSMVVLRALLGAKRGTSALKFGAAKPAGYLSWSATRIRCKVPSTAPFGTLKVRVTTDDGTSNAMSFKVRR